MPDNYENNGKETETKDSLNLIVNQSINIRELKIKRPWNVKYWSVKYLK